ncbi:hypothetical protein [Halorussus amylolyticus]|uniref:hypothetical protein n=1 Tax=Halorussus amylolyticus TaxID=1126242 RepID=UPI00138F8682|nr:hypothetical protein [Halorussus amylolyticus]
MKNAHDHETALSNRSLDRLATPSTPGGVLGAAENAAVRARVETAVPEVNE